MILFCILATRHQHNTYLVFSVLSSGPIFLLQTIRVFVLLYSIYVVSQNVQVIGINQKLMCPIQFQPHLIFLKLPNGIF
jgi:hypothetical protein